jgi:hypothetical protein
VVGWIYDSFNDHIGSSGWCVAGLCHSEGQALSIGQKYPSLTDLQDNDHAMRRLAFQCGPSLDIHGFTVFDK